MNRHARRLTCALIFTLGISACASSPQTRLLLDNPPDLPAVVELSEVPFFPQQQYHCGPAALAGIINYRGTTVVPDEIANLIYIPELKGSLQVKSPPRPGNSICYRYSWMASLNPY